MAKKTLSKTETLPIYTREKALDDYSAELGYVNELKQKGILELSSEEYGNFVDELSETTIPIQTILCALESKLAEISQLKPGESADQFNY